ncbi:MAG TPA: hypothetical protein VJ872_11705 [Nocardioides sp.]|nr:hypothetical protein [Nocardioides sp.]
MDDVLEGYLQNHWTAAAAGVSLFHRVARTHGDPAAAVAVGEVAHEVEADRDTLRGVMRSLDVRPSFIGAVVGRVGAELGRLKPNGRILRRSPLTDVVELEALRDAVYGKRCGWESLRTLADEEPRLDTELLEELIARADRQLERLRRIHLAVARERAIA